MPAHNRVGLHDDLSLTLACPVPGKSGPESAVVRPERPPLTHRQLGAEGEGRQGRGRGQADRDPSIVVPQVSGSDIVSMSPGDTSENTLQNQRAVR